jgi:hypothetical protein
MPARFRAIIVFEGLETGDRRKIAVGALNHRALPLTLMGMTRNPDGGFGHDGAEVVARIDTLTRQDATNWVDQATGQTWGAVAAGPVFAWVGEGEFADRAEAVDVEQLVREQHLRGISVDLAEVTADLQVLEEDADGWPVDWLEVVTEGMIAAATVCNIPAFRGCTIELVGETTAPPVAVAASGTPWLPAVRVLDDCLPCRDADAVTAAGGPLAPPAAWFDAPALSGPTPLVIEDDGRVYGHLAAWGTCHTGMPGRCVTPPKSLSGYSLFRVGAVRTAEGDDVAVGHITLGGGHADLRADTAAALAHYDDTGTAVADVSAGEDAHGIWVAGALRPGVTDEQVRALRAAPLSGDWRRHGSGLELVAALAVNVPGFPVVRSVAASGAPLALVAAGARPVVEAGRPQVDVATVRAAVRAELAPVLRRDALARLRAAGVGRQ